MTETINPKTGLQETHHDYYGVPLVQQKGLNVLRFQGQATAVHTVPINEGLTLDFYARLNRSEELLVSFHGAIPPSRLVYPRFERVASLRSKGRAMMAFADPTFLVDPNREMVSAWFLGGPGWDPLPLILRAIKKAMGKTGAKHVLFTGGSGGGFAALRASAMIPSSLAFVQDPQTNLATHNPVNIDRYFATVWPGWKKEDLLHAFPERFDMVRHYQVTRPNNFVYYAQNSSDTGHVEKQYTPFATTHGVPVDGGMNSLKNRYFALYNGEMKGHGKITPNEFSEHFDKALKFWRDARA